MRSLNQCRLYGILDLGYVSADRLEDVTEALLQGGVEILQLRAKQRRPLEVADMAARVLPVTRSFGVPLVINDHPAVAADVGAEGVHVGQDDSSLPDARAIVGGACFVGKSTHSLAQASAAFAEGADYIGFGPLHATGTKPDYAPIGLGDVAAVRRMAPVPVFCIGGINRETLPLVLTAGATRVAVVSAFLRAPDIVLEVQRLKAMLAATGPSAAAS